MLAAEAAPLLLVLRTGTPRQLLELAAQRPDVLAACHARRLLAHGLSAWLSLTLLERANHGLAKPVERECELSIAFDGGLSLHNGVQGAFTPLALAIVRLRGIASSESDPQAQARRGVTQAAAGSSAPQDTALRITRAAALLRYQPAVQVWRMGEHLERSGVRLDAAFDGTPAAPPGAGASGFESAERASSFVAAVCAGVWRRRAAAVLARLQLMAAGRRSAAPPGASP